MLRLDAFQLCRDSMQATFTISGGYEELNRIAEALFGAAMAEFSAPKEVDVSKVAAAVKETLRENGVRVA